MDIQLKRGYIEICVLASMLKEETYGYKLIKDIEPIMDISESTLYPILRRLETAHFLTVRTAEHNGRLRKYYNITDAGRGRIEEFKEEWKEMISIFQFITREGDGCDKT